MREPGDKETRRQGEGESGRRDRVSLSPGLPVSLSSPPRRGYSLIEMIVVMTVGATLMGIAVTLLGALMQAERGPRAHRAKQRARPAGRSVPPRRPCGGQPSGRREDRGRRAYLAGRFDRRAQRLVRGWLRRDRARRASRTHSLASRVVHFAGRLLRHDRRSCLGESSARPPDHRPNGRLVAARPRNPHRRRAGTRRSVCETRHGEEVTWTAIRCE